MSAQLDLNPLSERSRVVIIGAGQAGGECAAELRAGGFQGSITLIGEEFHPPYNRPLVSKAYCAGTVELPEVLLRPTRFYESNAIDLRTGVKVTSITPDVRSIQLQDRSELAYDRLVIATGGRPRRLNVPALESAPNALYVRTIGDIDALKSFLQRGSRLAVIGGGYLGLEIAASAREFGAQVVVVEAGPRLLGRVTSEVVSDFYLRLHRAEGVAVHVGAQVEQFAVDDTGVIEAIVLAGDERLDVDAVVVATGMQVNDELAVSADLDVDNGILVDETCLTSDPYIFAIGDCTRHPDLRNGGLRRLESAPNAAEQARIVAWTLLGRTRSYDSVPWFWSDQYDVKLKMVGLPTEHDDVVVRGDPSTGRSFAVFYLKEGRVQSSEIIGSARDFAMAKKLVTAQAKVDRADLADLNKPLKDILGEAA